MINFKTIHTLFYLIFLCVTSQVVHAVSTINGISKMRIRAGYGYLGRSSEAEANSELELNVCEKSGQKKCEYLNESAFGFFGYMSNINNYSKNFLYDANFLEKVREQLFEYLSLQMTAVDKSFVGEIPKCLIRNKKVKKMNDYVVKLRKGQKSKVSKVPKRSLRDYYYGNNNSLSKSNSFFDSLNNNDSKNKIIAIEGSLRPHRIAEAALTYEYLNRAALEYCNPTVFDSTKLLCIDIKQKRDRIKFAFPVVATDNLLPLIAQIIGFDNASTSAKNKKRGERIIDQYLPPVKDGYFKYLLGHSSTIYNKAIANISKEHIDKKHERIRTNFFEMIKKMKRKLKNKFQNDLNKICQKSFSNILEDYPVVIRQMYLDLQDQNEKNNFKKYLCKKDFMKFFQNGVVNNCIGVSGNINDPNGIIVRKLKPNYPFATNNFYRIKKDKNAGLIIELPRRYNFVYDPTIDPSHQDYDSTTSVSMQRNLDQQEKRFFRTIKVWNKKMEKFVNNAGENHIPKVRLKIINSKKAKPINVSTCYSGRSEPKGYSSSKVESFGDVLENNITPGKYRCGVLKEYNLKNRRSSSNYSIEMKDNLLFHENNHKLYVDDSYDSYKLSTTLIGEVDDVMGSDLGNTTQLYPRDIKRMIFPALNCID